METIFDEVTLYKDRDYSSNYETKHTVKVKGRKAKVVNPYGGVFGMRESSRLNKLDSIGMIDKVYLYRLKVEGKWIYLKLKYNIYDN